VTEEQLALEGSRQFLRQSEGRSRSGGEIGRIEQASTLIIILRLHGGLRPPVLMWSDTRRPARPGSSASDPIAGIWPMRPVRPRRPDDGLVPTGGVRPNRFACVGRTRAWPCSRRGAVVAEPGPTATDWGSDLGTKPDDHRARRWPPGPEESARTCMTSFTLR
jgi:hypothetical protein